MTRKSADVRAQARAIVTSMLLLAPVGCAGGDASNQDGGASDVDQELSAALQRAGFTGMVGQSLEQRLGRPLNPEAVELGRLIFFDKIQGLHDDNSCAGCHAPGAGFGDFQSIAVGIDNNDVVGPGRLGPRNQRRTPMVLNNAFYPKLMWNGGANGDAYYVHVQSATFDLESFAKVDAPSRFDFVPATWTKLVDSTSGAATLTVARFSGGSAKVAVDHKWTIAPASMRGTIYYWANNVGRVMRIKPGATVPDDIRFWLAEPISDQFEKRLKFMEPQVEPVSWVVA